MNPRAASRASSIERDAAAAQHFGLGNVRRHDQRARQQLRPQHLHAVVVEQAVAALRTITGSTTTSGSSSSSIAAATASTIAAVASMPVLVACKRDVAGDRFDLRRDEIGGQRAATSMTPTVFCAVMAVMALVP